MSLSKTILKCWTRRWPWSSPSVRAAAHAAALNIADAPLFLNGTRGAAQHAGVGSRPQAVLRGLCRDHSDLDGDGTLDIGYKGYETDATGSTRSTTTATSTRTSVTRIAATTSLPSARTARRDCPGEWSGDLLNYLTTSRIDALRKVLYGGLRSTDDSPRIHRPIRPSLERSLIPQDAHSSGQEYTRAAVDRYDVHALHAVQRAGFRQPAFVCRYDVDRPRLTGPGPSRAPILPCCASRQTAVLAFGTG